jgi:group I intron endonuclease
MFIYKTTNLKNGLIYIGRYSGERKSYIGSGKVIRNAIKKYGRENFIREIIEDNIIDNDILNEREIYWIAFYDSANPKIGYNLAKGGKGVVGFSRSEETKRKLSEINKGENNPNFGKPRPDDVKNKISESEKGSKNHNFGKVTSEETKQKISNANKGRKHTEDELEKMSQSNMGEKNHNFGKTMPDDVKQKISVSNMGKVYTKEHNEKISNAMSGSCNPMYGKTHDEETKELMSESHIGIKSPGNHTSKYVGVYWYGRIEKWSTRIIKNGKTYFMGYFDNEDDAARAWNKKAIELGVPFDRLNVIGEIID